MKFEQFKHELAILREPSNGYKGLMIVACWEKPEGIEIYEKFLKERYYMISHTGGTKSIHPDFLRYNFFDIITCPESSFAQDVLNFDIHGTPVFTYHECVAQHYIPEEHSFEKIYDVITVMRIDHQKLWMMICDLAERYPNRLFLAVCKGFGEETGLRKEDADYIKDRMRSLSNLEIRDGVPQYELKQIMCQTRMMIHPCDFEPGPLAVSDALACDLPVMLPSNVFAGSKKLISPKTGLFFNYADIFNRFELMFDLIDKGVFSPREYYLRHWGLENHERRFKEFIQLAIDEDYPVEEINFSLARKSGPGGINSIVGKAMGTMNFFDRWKKEFEK